MMKKNAAIGNWRYAILALGVSVCLIGALLMVAGEGILGESHSGIAAVVGIIGIGLISTSNTRMASKGLKEPRKQTRIAE